MASDYISKTTNDSDIEGRIKLSNVKRAVLGSHRTPLEDGNFLRSLARLLLGRDHAGRGKRHGVRESRGCRRPSFSPVASVQLHQGRAHRGGVEAKETALRRTNGWGTETREHAQIQYLLVRLLLW